MEHLALEIFDLDGKHGSKYATLNKDTSITITDTSEIFASGDVWTYQFALNIHANAHIFGTSGEIHGARLHEQINKRKARLWIDGLSLYMGYLRLDNEVSVTEDGNVDVTFESGQKTFDEMIEGGKANQVPMMSDVRFGVALWRKRFVTVGFTMTAQAKFTNGWQTNEGSVKRDLTEDEKRSGINENIVDFYSEGERNPLQEYPRMVFTTGSFKNLDSKETEEVNYLNTDYPYDDAHPYCNIALCYQKQGYEKYKNENDKVETYNDYSSAPTPLRDYETMPANRVNSAPNFYVIYWVRSLMKHLGITIEENQMMNVEDLRRLFFVNTKCAYKEPEYIRTGMPPEGMNIYKFTEGNRLIGETFAPVKTKKGIIYCINQQLTKITDSGFKVNDYTSNINSLEGFLGKYSHHIRDLKIDRIIVRVSKVLAWGHEVKNLIEDRNSFLHDAIATSDCFPNTDISEVIKCLENAFGLRLLFSDNYQRVRIVLLRNLFRSTDIQHISCNIINSTKVENGIRGFRLTYGNSEDTTFYYKGFADKMSHKSNLWIDTSDTHDYSHWNLDANYANIIHRISAFDKTCYVTPNTGNAYGIKVDRDAKRYEDLHPALFEYAGFVDAEDGDCTGEKDTITEISMGFTPAIMNDLNMKSEREGDLKQRFALFVKETMRPRRPALLDGKDYNNPTTMYDVDTYLYGDKATDAINKMKHNGIVKPGEFSITSDMYATASKLKVNFTEIFSLEEFGMVQLFPSLSIKDMSIEGHVNEGYRLYLQDNFEPNDNGVSPIETHDWGITLGIMRSSGSDAHINYSDDSDDGEGNYTWEIEPGQNATAHPDTCDSYGNLWDYNGSIVIKDRKGAIEELKKNWPNSNIDLLHDSGSIMRNEKTYIKAAFIHRVTTNTGEETNLLFVGDKYDILDDVSMLLYINSFKGKSIEEMFAYDAGPEGKKILIEANSSYERRETLLKLEEIAFSGQEITEPLIIDSNGVGSTEGRISLKLRAEKPNPHFDPKKPESKNNRRHLQISNSNLRGRGLADQFYKEYSYWVRNARICKLTVQMELAQLLAIDKTQRVTVGDITGFIRKMQYTVSNDGGLGLVTMEIMYI